MNELNELLEQILTDDIKKIVISKQKNKEVSYRKIDIEKKENFYQAAKYTEKQVFHENLQPERLLGWLLERMKSEYGQLNAWSDAKEYSLLISKKGQVSFAKKTRKEQVKMSSDHNRKKNYLLQEGNIIPPLLDMGIFTKEGKVVASMYDKFKQINRFLEIVDDSVKEWEKDELNIIDFGCGKSYLTFILYYYFTEIRKRKVNMIGLDLKEDVIRKCNAAAQKYGYENLKFELGDINGYQCEKPVDIVVTLHACDTATDYALHNALTWKASMIFSVPCCHHEVNGQMRTDDLKLLTKYGIVKERFAALLTDSIRANLLEYSGYKTQLLEFVDLSHTPKNLLIRAVRRDITPRKLREQALREAEAAMEEFHCEPMLYQLLVSHAKES